MKDVSLKWYGDKVTKATQEALLAGLRVTGESALRFAEPDIPVETGTLQRSGTVTVGGLPEAEKVYQIAESGGRVPVEEVGDKLEVNVSYNTPYGLKLHETQSWQGRLKPEAKWKWLERGMERAWRNVDKYIKRAAGRMKV